MGSRMHALLLLLALLAPLSSAEGDTIHDAILARQPEEVEVLLLRNPGLSNSVDRRGMSAMVMAVHQAAKYRSQFNPERKMAVEVIKILAKAGADPNIECTIRFSSKLADTCIGYGAALAAEMAYGLRKISPAVLAALCGVHEAVELFGTEGANTGSWVTPLSAAAFMGHEKAVKILLSHGANVEDTGPSERRTPLLVAAAAGDLWVVRYLIEGGADIDAANVAGITPLMAAAYFANVEVVKELIAVGADIRKQMRLYLMDRRMGGKPTYLHAVEMSIGLRFLDTSSKEAGLIEIALEGAFNDREADLRGRREILKMVMHSWEMATNMNSLLPGYELDEDGNPTTEGGARSRNDEF